MEENKAKYTITKTVNAFKCLRCKHEWIPRVNIEELTNEIKTENIPLICPHCKTAYWKKERINKPRKQK